MNKQASKFKILDNYFITLFGMQIVFFVTLIYFESEIRSLLPIPFASEKEAVLTIVSVSFLTIIFVKLIHFYVTKYFAGKSFQSKVFGFVIVTITELTLLVIVNIFILVTYVLMNSYFFLFIFGLFLLLQFAYRPRLHNFRKEFNVSNNNSEKIQTDF